MRPLPYDSADRLVLLFQPNIKKGLETQYPTTADFYYLREKSRTLAQLAGWNLWFHALGGPADPEQVVGVRSTSNFFELLGVEPFLGRMFLPEEEQFGHHRVVVLTHRLWLRRYDSDPEVVGKSILIDDESYTVVGVLPESFYFPKFFLGNDYELWMPLSLDRMRHNRTDPGPIVYGVLAPGRSLEEAQAELDSLAKQLAESYPETHQELSFQVGRLSDYKDDLQTALFLVMAAVGGVLLIACANVANLQLSRSAVRQREIAVRSALGARRLRLIRQLLTENLILSVVGAVAGLVLAYWGVDLFAKVAPVTFPRVEKIAIDGRVLVFTTFIALLSGILLGLIPALQSCRPDLVGFLKEGGRAPILGRRGRRTQNLLIVSQVGLALMLLVGTSLMIKSYFKLVTMDRGISTQGLLTLQIWLPKSKFPEAHQVSGFLGRVLEEVKALPRVESVTAISFLPMRNWAIGADLVIAGRPPPTPEEKMSSDYRVVAPDYFQTLEIPLIKGRFLGEQDGLGTAPVAMIDQHAADRFWPDQDPLGQRIRLKRPGLDRPWHAHLNESWLTIVGVVGSLNEDRIVPEQFWPTLYLPYRQSPSNLMSLVVRTRSEPLASAPSVRKAVRSVDAAQPISLVMTMEDVIARSFWDSRGPHDAPWSSGHPGPGSGPGWDLCRDLPVGVPKKP